MVSLLIAIYPEFFAAQSPYLFQHFDTRDGLSDDQVTHIFQDSRGFIWIATQNGLNRFDGHDVEPYFYDASDTNSLSGNWVSAMAEDGEGNLWFGTNNNGLNRFDPRTGVFTRLSTLTKDQLPSEKMFIRKLLNDREGRIWAATNSGLFHQTGKTTFTRVSPETCDDLGLDSAGTVWVATHKGVYFIKNGRSVPEHVAGINDRIVSLAVHPAGHTLWLYTMNGLKRLENSGARWEMVDCHISSEKLANNDIFFRVLLDRQGRIWAAARTGLWVLENRGAPPRKISHAAADPRSIMPGPVRAVFEDRTGNIWIGTTSGVSLLTPDAGRFRHARFPAKLMEVKQVKSVLRDSSGLWYATPKGLYFWRNNSFSAGELVLKAPITRLFKSHAGSLYAASGEMNRSGFYQLDPYGRISFYGEQAKDENSFRGGTVWSLAEDLAGRIWVGAWDNLHCFDPAEQKFIHFNTTWDTLCNSAGFLDLKTDLNGDLWIATMGCGLFRLKKAHLIKKVSDARFDNFKNVPGDSSSLSSNMVQALLQTAPDTLWVGTGGGLNCFHAGRFKRFLRQDGLPDEDIKSLIEGPSDRIWMSTNKGLICFEPHTGTAISYTKADGLCTDAFSFQSAFLDTTGPAFFGTEEGLQIFDLYGFQKNNPIIPPLLFTRLTIDGRPASWGKAGDALSEPPEHAGEIILQPGYQTATLQYAALYYGNQAHVRYWIQLEGLHRDWVDNGAKREIAFTGLWPRTYTLRVKATNADEGWVAYSRSLHVRVLPPFYLSWPALLFYLLLLSGSVYALYRFHLRRQLAAAETRRLRELDIFKNRFFANITHEFRTPLTAVLGAAAQIRQKPAVWLQEGLDMIERNGQDLLRLVNEMLELSRLEAGVIAVQAIQGDVVHYLRYLSESFHSLAAHKNIRLVFDTRLPVCLMDYDPDKLKKVFNNLLSNALKFTPPGGTIRVKVSAEPMAGENRLRFSVTDTGPGIDPEQLPRIFDRYFQGDAGRKYAGGAGIGLALSKELVQLLGGALWAESRPGEGAKFTVLLPVTNQAPLPSNASGLAEMPGTAASPIAGTPDAPSDASERLLLLLVEDNADVSRYLAELLRAQYRLEFARDGQEGIDKALELIPDLIVSDVMMPRKDGFELCRTLKNEPATSHIPIVLLTARADMDSRLEGLEDGADEYLVKPFDERELQARIHNLLRLRRQLRERYERPGPAPTPTSAAFRREDAFFKTLNAALEQHFADPAFGVPELCRQVHLSRASLYRKLTALTGNNIETYLRRFRLEKARALLLSTDLPVQVVAWDCGFNDAAYFTKAFQGEYGVTPSQGRG